MKPNRKVTKFETGAVRAPNEDPVRYDLISPIALRRVAETCFEGAEKYGPNNWLNGIPPSNLLNHAMTHIEKWKQGDKSEDHLAHAVWNLMALIHFEVTRSDLFEQDKDNLIYREE